MSHIISFTQTTGKYLSEKFDTLASQFGHDAVTGPLGQPYSIDELHALNDKYNALLKESLSGWSQFFDPGTWTLDEGFHGVAADFVEYAGRGRDGLRSKLDDIVAHGAGYPADYIAAAKQLITTMDNATACVAAHDLTDVTAKTNKEVKSLAGVSRTIPTDPRLALCPK